MGFTALEGKFPRHPKLLSFSRADRWTWVEILCYCSDYRTDGIIPAGIEDVVRHATKTRLRAYADAGLLDYLAGSNGHVQYAVHDWDEYNGTGRERREARERKRRQRETREYDGADDC